MKVKTLLFTIFFLSSLFVLNAQTDSQKITGIWKLVIPDNAPFSGDFGQIKIIIDGHFVWTGYDKDGIAFNGAGGEYTFENGVYTETIKYGYPPMASYIGKQAVYKKVVFEGNRMRIFGLLGDDFEVIEQWEKIE